MVPVVCSEGVVTSQGCVMGENSLLGSPSTNPRRKPNAKEGREGNGRRSWEVFFFFFLIKGECWELRQARVLQKEEHSDREPVGTSLQ
jgi:hypothetical protein